MRGLELSRPGVQEAQSVLSKQCEPLKVYGQ